MKQEEQFKDYLGKTVKVGDTVVVLCKEYGYRKLANARLIKLKYKGKSRGGYDFGTDKEVWYSIRNPECVKI